MKYKDKIPHVALMLGDIEGSPYYPLFTDEQYNQFLTMSKGDVNGAVVSAAISASFIVSSEATREVIGDLSISKSTGSNYLKALDYLIKNTNKQIPAGLMPWVGGLGERNKLLDFRLCDSHGRCGPHQRGHHGHKHKDPLHEVIVEVHNNRVIIDEHSEQITENTKAIAELSTETGHEFASLSSSVSILDATTATLELKVAGNIESTESLKPRVTTLEMDSNRHTADVTQLKSDVKSAGDATAAVGSRVTFLEGDRLVTLQRIMDAEGRISYTEVNDLYGGSDGNTG